MTAVQPCELPQGALLRRYQDGGGFADCYFTDVVGAHSHAEFVEAFYTTPLFKVERAILSLMAGRPSTDLGARQLAQGAAESFAVWRVEERCDNQLLLGDFTGRTKSWLMAEPVVGAKATRLYFGSAVLPHLDPKTGRREMGAAFNALLGFHRLYSRALLASARQRLQRQR